MPEMSIGVGVPRIGTAASCKDAIERWRQDRIARGDKPAAVKKQAKRLETACAAAGWKNTADIQREFLVAEFNRLATAGNAPKTVDTLRSMFNSWLGWCESEGLLEANPCATIPRRSRQTGKGPNTRKGMRAFVGDEPIRLIAAAERDEKSEKPKHRVIRSLAYRMFLATGARKGQITMEDGVDSSPIRWCDLDLDSASPGVTFVDAKNGENWFVPLVPTLVAHLKSWRATCASAKPADFVFPFRIMDRVINTDMEAAGIAKRGGPSNRPACFHSFRKTFCTYLVLSGTPVPVAQRLMQHKTVQQTLEVYSEVESDQLAKGIARVEDFLTGRSGSMPMNGMGVSKINPPFAEFPLPDSEKSANTSATHMGNLPQINSIPCVEAAMSAAQNLTEMPRGGLESANTLTAAAAGRQCGGLSAANPPINDDVRRALVGELLAHGRRLDSLLKLLLALVIAALTGAASSMAWGEPPPETTSDLPGRIEMVTP